MKRIASIFLAAALAAAVSCSGNGPEWADGVIRVRAGMEGDGVSLTKAPLTTELLTVGTQMCVYDILSSSKNYAKHLDGLTATKGDSDWSFPSTQSWLYNVTEKVDHNFFAWLTKDKKDNDADDITATNLFGTGYPSISSNSPDDGIYTITFPSTAMLLSKPQFDFSYSDVIQRKKEENNFSVVDFTLHHLFACFGISAKNYTSESITISSIKLHGLTDKKSATLVYDVNDGTKTVTYTADGTAPKSWTTDANSLELLASSITLEADGEDGSSVKNVITCTDGGSKTTTEAAYFLMWPQTDDEMDQVTTIDNTTSPIAYGVSDPVLVVTYTTGSSATAVTAAVPIRPSSQDGKGWDAGSRHCIELAFSEKQLSLCDNVLNWNYETQTIDYSNEPTAAITGAVSYSGCIFGSDATADCIFFKNNNPITGTFKLDSPVDATWMIAKEGDFDAFEIDNKATGTAFDGIDVNYGTIDSQTATFTICPKIDDPSRDYEITLTFTVRMPNGNVVNVDDLVQPKLNGENKVTDANGTTVIYKRRIILQAS